jgi:hypothetical protein
MVFHYTKIEVLLNIILENRLKAVLRIQPPDRPGM